MKKIYLVDVSSMFFRAFYAIRPLSSSKGVPVNAVYGFISMIVKLLKEKNPEYVVFCYDRKEPSFRKEIDSNYKANRTEMPEDMQVQMPYLKKVGSLLGIADIEMAGFEADDLIGAIAHQAKNNNFQTYIVSGDKDFCQLIDENTFLYDTMKEVVFNREMVKEKHGVYPEQFIDYLAITGDASDNIPGVAGIGPKGAVKLIEEFGTVEGIYENIDKVSSASIKEKLIKSRDNAFMSKKLVSIVTEINTGRDLESYRRQAFKTEELREFLQDLNFKNFEKTLLADPTEQKTFSKLIGHVDSNPVQTPTVIDDNSVSLQKLEWSDQLVDQKIQDFMNLKKSPSLLLWNSELIIGFDHEFLTHPLSGLNIQFDKTLWSGFDLKKVWTELGLSADVISKVQVQWDLMLVGYTIKSSDSSDFFKLIKSFLKEEYDEKTVTHEKIYELYVRLQKVLIRELNEKNLISIYEKMEKPLIPILYQMEREGIRIDQKFLNQFSKELGQEIKKLETEIHELAGEEFNVASPKQLGVILFEKMGIEAIKKTKTGYSTDSDVLEQIAHPIAKKIIQYRENAKLKSTYVDALPEQADANSRVHTSFNQALTATGRLSSTGPNLQNIPIKTELGRKVRKAFCSDEGKKLLSVDYSQIELRVLAHISNDEGLMNAFRDDLDIHSATASEVFSVPLKSVTSEQRRIAKAVNFGIAYGQGAFGLAETLGISRTESKSIIEKYFIKFKGIKEYIDQTIEQAHEKKYVETLMGRRRYLPELDSTNAMIKKFGERAAINAPIQGSASDLVKMAMIDLSKVLPSLNIKMLLQVHDELIFEGAENDLQAALPKIKFKMESVVKLKVPLKVNSAIGLNWEEAH